MITKEELAKLLEEILEREYKCFLHGNRDVDDTQWLAATLATIREIAKKFDVEIGIDKEVK